MHTPFRATRAAPAQPRQGGRAHRALHFCRAGLTARRKPCVTPQGFGLFKRYVLGARRCGRRREQRRANAGPGAREVPAVCRHCQRQAQPEGAEPEGTRAGHTPPRAAHRAGPTRDPVQEGAPRQQRSTGAAGVARARHVSRWGQCRRWNSREPPSQTPRYGDQTAPRGTRDVSAAGGLDRDAPPARPRPCARYRRSPTWPSATSRGGTASRGSRRSSGPAGGRGRAWSSRGCPGIVRLGG